MIKNIICYIAQIILLFRYRVKIKGLNKIDYKNKAGFLILPNHPGLIDPIIISSFLYPYFKLRSLADENQVKRPVIKWFAKLFRVITVSDATKGGKKTSYNIEQALEKCGSLIDKGENILLYPSGHIQKNRFEEIGGNSGVKKVLESSREAEIILVKTTGLWGSSLSRASGEYPKVYPVLKKALKVLVFNLLVFIPKRKVTITLSRPDDFPYDKDKKDINKYLENFYNASADKNTYVPYYFFERGGVRNLPEPEFVKHEVDLEAVPDSVKKIVSEKIMDLTGKSNVNPEKKLSDELGMDSLSKLELAVWVEKEFGFHVSNPDIFEKVKDIMGVAGGQIIANEVKNLEDIPKSWFYGENNTEEVKNIEKENLAEAFLDIAARNPKKIISADQNSGVKSYNDLITGILVLKKFIKKLSHNYVGIMLPASVGAIVCYMSVIFSGKIPVMINWTVGRRNFDHTVNILNVEKILTSKKLIEKLKEQGVEFDGHEQKFQFLEDFVSRAGLFLKIKSKLRACFCWRQLRKEKIDDCAVVLFTSGSESMPKAVPLSHKNILTNINDIISLDILRSSYSLLGFLPPFHSFGLTATMMMPLLSGVRAVYHPNPTEGGTLAKMIELYKVDVLIGTPTFLGGILKGVSPESLKTLKFSVTGAEKCSEKIYSLIEEKCSQSVILEGYGITECSPVVSVNRPENPVRYSIGKLMPSLEYKILDVETSEEVKPGTKGMLYLKGDSVFDGYLKFKGKSPFVKMDGEYYYKTGDLVVLDPDTECFFFKGRLKRFVKLGGEMISLPAIEEVLIRELPSDDDKDSGPAYAVEAFGGDESPEIVLFSTENITREEANEILNQKGFSGLCNIRKVKKVDEIPVLGTGKTDYRSLHKFI
ncbi:MAG: AMP-binding protein [Candidatus Muiribacteriota bacterium]